MLQGYREAGVFIASSLGATFSTQNTQITGSHELLPWGHTLNGQPSRERECSAHFHTSLFPSGRQLGPPCQTPSEEQADGGLGGGWTLSVQSREGQGCSLVLLRVWAWEQSTQVWLRPSQGVAVFLCEASGREKAALSPCLGFSFLGPAETAVPCSRVPALLPRIATAFHRTREASRNTSTPGGLHDSS